MRIVSLVPSQTELLYDLGLDAEVVGITKFCVHPQKWFKEKTRIGGTKTINVDLIKSLKPDLILCNKEENVRDQVEQLALFSQLYLSDIENLSDALEMIASIGKLVDKSEKATQLIENIDTVFADLASIKSVDSLLSVAYLIWNNPYMAAGGDTFINDMLERSGFVNVFKHLKRYPEISVELLTESNCQLVFLSSEPFPFKQKHIEQLQAKLHGTKILLVDGEMFSWYGSRLLHAARYFKQLVERIHQQEV